MLNEENCKSHIMLFHSVKSLFEILATHVENDLIDTRDIFDSPLPAHCQMKLFGQYVIFLFFFPVSSQRPGFVLAETKQLCSADRQMAILDPEQF